MPPLNLSSLSLSPARSSPGSSIGDDEEYDSVCNARLNPRGINVMCRNDVSHRALENRGWVRLRTSGANSFIYRKGTKILKVRKSHILRRYFCENVFVVMENIRRVHRFLGMLVPRLYHLKVCARSGEPAIMIVMQNAGVVNAPMPEVSSEQIEATSRAMVSHGIFSRDVFTETLKVNVGNLAFRLTKERKILRVTFLDFDDVNQFVWTQRCDDVLMQRLWSHVIRRCLHLPSQGITYEEWNALREQFVSLIEWNG